MTNYENIVVKNIRSQYEERSASKLDQLKALDRRVKVPAEVFAYIFGSLSSLVLGTGMCMAMEVIGSGLMMPGIAVGVAGIALVTANYFIYKKLLDSRKRKYAEQIMELSDSILG